MKPYLSPVEFKILAHRGSTEGGAVENTLEAFQAAIDFGIRYLETDVQATSDGVAVLFHDPDLSRIAGIKRRVSQLSFLQLSALMHQGKPLGIPKLVDALKSFPNAKFNLDLKTKEAIAPSVSVIKELLCENRVLVSSFSGRRRRKALKALPGVATSPNALLVLRILFATKLGKSDLLRHLLKDIDVLQIPVNAAFVRFDKKSFINLIHSHGVDIHFWTINDIAEAKRLKQLGADGIVTDASKLMVSVFGNEHQE